MTPTATGSSPTTRATDVAALAEAIASAGSVVALTGAGISVPSGIPDFRSEGKGLWANVDPMSVAHIEVFNRDPQHFWRFYGDRFASLEHCEPNAAHASLVELERRGLLDAVITQNIDMLHRKAGTETLVEVHGSIATASCLRCGTGYELEQVHMRLADAGDGVPRCDCDEPLKPDVILFGENLPAQALRDAERLAAGADLLLCAGTSLEVYPVAALPSLTLAAGGAVAIVTQGATPLDDEAQFRLDGDIVDELGALVAALI